VELTMGYPVRYVVALSVLLVAFASWLFVTYRTAHTSIDVTNLWMRETTGTSAVVHATITNRGVHRDRLVRLSSNFASRFVILNFGHEIESLRIPADSEFLFGDDLLRIEAVGLARAIRANERLPILFVFEHAGKITVQARVENVHSVGND
jgi:copper(I)-binding protein